MEEGRDIAGRFVKGHKKNPLSEAKQIASMRESWRERKDYIGDLVSECPRIHSSWRAMRFGKKGKIATNDPSWNNYRTFYHDVRPTYKPGLVFRRKDISKPFSKDNFVWVSTIDAAEMYLKNRITYNGETLSLRDWADKLNISANTIKLRYYKHRDDWSTRDILFGKQKKRNTKTAKDATVFNIRAKASKMISSYRNKDIKNGTALCDIDIDWMIDNILTKPCVYCGDTHRIGCDRIDNSKGHTKDNVVPCCIECNTARNNYFTYEEMLLLGKTIAKIKKARKN